MKNFDLRYLGNYWADSLPIKTEMYSLARATILGMSLPVMTSGKKARQRSKVICIYKVQYIFGHISKSICRRDF